MLDMTFLCTEEGFYNLWVQNYLDTSVFLVVKNGIAEAAFFKPECVGNDIGGVNFSIFNQFQNRLYIPLRRALPHFECNIPAEEIAQGEGIIPSSVNAHHCYCTAFSYCFRGYFNS